MTKARDLAGFASSSVTTTASDGLVLKGDGSTTDVIIKNGANATVATVADGTTDLSKVLARGYIDVGNASGVSAPLAKGAAGTVLTAGASDLSWVEASGGGEQTFTASGSISAGALVGINSNGTISTMGATAGTPVQFHPNNMDSSRGSYKAIVYDTANNKVIQFYRDTANNYYLTCVVGTISGQSISYGTPVVTASKNIIISLVALSNTRVLT